MDRSFPPFTAYSSAQVFVDVDLNILCNRFVDRAATLPGIIPGYTMDTQVNTVALTGTCAKILQGAANEEIKCISFITADIEVFRKYKKLLPEILPFQSAEYFKTCYQIKTAEGYFELWYSDTAINTVSVDGVHVQETSEIPTTII